MSHLHTKNFPHLAWGGREAKSRANEYSYSESASSLMSVNGLPGGSTCTSRRKPIVCFLLPFNQHWLGLWQTKLNSQLSSMPSPPYLFPLLPFTDRKQGGQDQHPPWTWVITLLCHPGLSSRQTPCNSNSKGFLTDFCL